MVILEIFASRARTAEAKLQVELARSRYALSHLVRGAEASYAQQRGGVGFIFGGGEKALELRRRELRNHIKVLQDKLKGGRLPLDWTGLEWIESGWHLPSLRVC